MASRRILDLMFRCGVFLLCALTPLLVGQASPDEAIHDIDVCEVLRNPIAFDHQTIRFRGRLEFEFEGDQVDVAACGLPLIHTGIWWDYGGRSILALQQEAKSIRASTSPVVRDSEFDHFQKLVQEHRSKRPDGEMCSSHRECAYYDVVATYTGRFFARRMPVGRTLFGGFGHMGCCHLLVIEQISDVVAQRTSVPEDGPKFSCASQTWQSEFPAVHVSSLDERATANQQFLAAQMRAHGDDGLAETVTSSPLRHYEGFTGYLIWSSPDLLTTYTAEFPQPPATKKKKHQTIAPTSLTSVGVTRERCDPTTD